MLLFDDGSRLSDIFRINTVVTICRQLVFIFRIIEPHINYQSSNCFDPLPLNSMYWYSLSVFVSPHLISVLNSLPVVEKRILSNLLCLMFLTKHSDSFLFPIGIAIHEVPLH